MSTIYIAGPMTGIHNFNAKAFADAAEQLRARGWSVVSPLEMDQLAGDTYEEQHKSGKWEHPDRAEYLRRDIQTLASGKIHAIYMLNGWSNSTGANLELEVADGLGLDVYYERGGLPLPPNEPEPPAVDYYGYDPETRTLWPHQRPYMEGDSPTFEILEFPTDSILERAEKLVHGDRGEAYGHPLDDFTRTAKAVSGLGFRFLPPGGGAFVREIEPDDIPLFMMCVKLSREVNKPGPSNLEDIAGYAETKYMVAQERKRREEF